MSLIRKAFKRLHYPVDIIAQCVRWYLAYALSLRNLEERMTERGVRVHSTLSRWVIRLTPLLGKAFRRHKRPVARRWCMDETYIKIKGQWKYLYRAVDTSGQTIDFLLTANRDTAAALRFFRKALRHHGEPDIITLDKSGANTAAIALLNTDKSKEKTIKIRQNKYLNKIIETLNVGYGRY
ncbi:transposase (fragment) [Xenorhabdus bovienii str. puntauvense]|uniref:Transposase n=2 Tax=Xenorhabdus bovienii TaxID=40576 RepID=A0A077NB55_XENBV